MKHESPSGFSTQNHLGNLQKTYLEAPGQAKVQVVLKELSSDGARVQANLFVQPGTDVLLILGDGNSIAANVCWRNAGEIGLKFGSQSKLSKLNKYSVPEGMYRKNGQFKVFGRYANK